MRRGWPTLFTLQPEAIAVTKMFTSLVPNERDTWCIENYLDDNLLAQYTEEQENHQIPMAVQFFNNGGIAVKLEGGDGEVRPMKRKILLGFKHDTRLECSTFRDEHKSRILALLEPIAEGRCRFVA